MLGKNLLQKVHVQVTYGPGQSIMKVLWLLQIKARYNLSELRIALGRIS